MWKNRLIRDEDSFDDDDDDDDDGLMRKNANEDGRKKSLRSRGGLGGGGLGGGLGISSSQPRTNSACAQIKTNVAQNIVRRRTVRNAMVLTVTFVLV